jgi:hypothetical protein
MVFSFIFEQWIDHVPSMRPPRNPDYHVLGSRTFNEMFMPVYYPNPPPDVWWENCKVTVRDVSDQVVVSSRVLRSAEEVALGMDNRLFERIEQGISENVLTPEFFKEDRGIRHFRMTGLENSVNISKLATILNISVEALTAHLEQAKKTEQEIAREKRAHAGAQNIIVRNQYGRVVQPHKAVAKPHSSKCVIQ